MVLYSYTAPSNFLFSQTQQWHRAYFAAIRRLRTIWRTFTEAGRVRFRGHRLHVSGKYFSTDCIFIQPHRMFPIGLGKIFHIGQVPVSGNPHHHPTPIESHVLTLYVQGVAWGNSASGKHQSMQGGRAGGKQALSQPPC